MVELTVFRCPSDFSNTQPASGGAVNYYGNKGTDIEWGSTEQTGVLFRESNIRFRDVTDGQSNTAAFAERVLTDGNNGISSPDSDVYLGNSAGSPTTPDEAMSMCQAVDVDDLANQFPVFMGAPWMDGQHTYQHVSGPNARSCGFFPTTATMPCSSRHPGGVNVLLCDGSTRFASENVNLSVWRAVGSRAGGEAIGEW